MPKGHYPSKNKVHYRKGAMRNASCGIRPKYDEYAPDWDKVTCKKCRKHR